MSKRVLPNILIIDDKENEQSGIKLYLEAAGLAHVEIRHPNDIDIGDLLTAQLVMVDYTLESWPDRDALPSIALKPSDGLALAALLRRQLREREDASPSAFAIYTGNLAHLAAPLPPENRQHTLASMNNLEWVFEKASADGSAPVGEQVAILAAAVQRLPEVWPSATESDSILKLAELLGVREADDEQLLEDIETCLPPIHELSQWSHGLAVLRWMLHRILPFPCFLWDTYRLAARFRVDYQGLLAALEKESRLQKQLGTYEYQGILAEFLGSRWWRSKIERFLWEATDGNSSDSGAVRAAISKAAGVDLTPSDPADFPILCVNTSYRPLKEFSPMDQAVRIRPDDWPGYADQAWTKIELAKSEPKLRALVIREDRGLLE